MEDQNTVSDIMTKPVVTIASGTSFLDLMELFQKHKYHFLPVCSPDGKLLGVVNKADYYQMLYSFDIYGSEEAYYHLTEELKKTTVEQVMRANTITVPPNLHLNSAISYLRSDLRNALIVIENEQVIGIVTLHDIFTNIFKHLKQ